MQYTQVKTPKWVNEEHTLIDCLVNFVDFSEDFVPFTASPTSDTPYGREIFSDCVAEKYGPVAEYVPPPPYVATADDNKQQAQVRLQVTDWVNEPDVYDTSRDPHLLNRNVFLDYRSWCRNIVVNPIAGNLNWPVEPTAIWS